LQPQLGQEQVEFCSPRSFLWPIRWWWQNAHRSSALLIIALCS